MIRIYGILAFITVLCAMLGPASAAEPVDTVQSVIRNQVEAFLNDDADMAYSFASPNIKAKFPDKAMFFDMVRRSYAPIYRPGNFIFGRSKIQDDLVVQEVLISAPDGKDWTAIYLLNRQPDSSYKINGVHIAQTALGKEI